jgi:hypothetical protein
MMNIIEECQICYENSIKNHRSKKLEDRFNLCSSCEKAINSLKFCPSCNQVITKDHYRKIEVTILGITGTVEEIKCPKKAA